MPDNISPVVTPIYNTYPDHSQVVPTRTPIPSVSLSPLSAPAVRSEPQRHTSQPAREEPIQPLMPETGGFTLVILALALILAIIAQGRKR